MNLYLENFLKDKTEALSRIEKLAFLSVHITRNHKSEISNLREVISSDIIEISKLREITKKLNNVFNYRKAILVQKQVLNLFNIQTTQATCWKL